MNDYTFVNVANAGHTNAIEWERAWAQGKASVMEAHAMREIWSKERKKNNVLKLLAVIAGVATTVFFFIIAVILVLIF